MMHSMGLVWAGMWLYPFDLFNKKSWRLALLGMGIFFGFLSSTGLGICKFTASQNMKIEMTVLYINSILILKMLFKTTSDLDR